MVQLSEYVVLRYTYTDIHIAAKALREVARAKTMVQFLYASQVSLAWWVCTRAKDQEKL